VPIIRGKESLMPPSLIWKLVLCLALGGAIFLSVFVRAPKRSFPRADLRGMVMGALALYLVGVVASLTHHGVVAAVLYACGISLSAFAAWLSRGSGPRRRRADEDPSEPPSPDGPGDEPLLDWTAFESQFRAYAHRHERRPARTR
jgi:hypothetical protein